MTAGTQRRARQTGQATVELAMILPVLLLLLLGMAEFALMTSNYVTLQHAVSEGARVAVAGANDTAVGDRIRATAPTLDAARLNITINPAGTRVSGTDVTINAQFDYQVMTPVINRIIGNQVPLRAAVAARVE